MSRSTRRSRGLRAGVAALVGLGAVALTAPAAQAASSLTITQVGGQSRYATAAQASAASFPAGVTRTAVIASGNSTVDALASSFVAGANSAPILLVTRDSIPDETKAELARLGVQRVILAGGTSVISADVATQLAASYTVARADGADRYETAAKLAALVSATPTTVFVASGPSDAAAISPIAAAKGWPILLTQPNAVPASTKQALAGYPGARVVVVGGTSAVTAQTATDLGSTVRLTGSDRFQTAVNVANFAIQSGFSATGFGLALGVNGANGNDLSDALTAGPILARTQSPLLLSEGPSSLGAQTQSFLSQNAARFTTSAVVFGGASAVSPSVVSSVATAAGTTVTPTTPTVPTDTVAPVLRASFPLSNATAVAANVSPTATFDEYLDVSGSTATIVNTASPGTPIAAAVSVVGSVITLDPTSDLAPGAQFRVTFSVRDIARNVTTPVQWTFTTVAQVPSVPGSVLATPTPATTGVATNGSLAVTWNAATANGSPVTGYTVTLTSGPVGFTLPAPVTVASSSPRSTTFTSLPVGTYTASIVANSAVGSSTAATASGTVAAPPATPTVTAGAVVNVLTHGASTGSATISWAAPATYGSAITNYTVSAAGPTTPASQTIAAGTTTATFSGLAAGSYTFTVVANSGAGSSTGGTTTSVVRQVADVPTSLATSGVTSGEEDLSWTAPSDNGGSAITGYEVQVYAGPTATGTPAVFPASTTSVTITGLTSTNQYTYTVTAITSVGTSAPSAPVTNTAP